MFLQPVASGLIYRHLPWVEQGFYKQPIMDLLNMTLPVGSSSWKGSGVRGRSFCFHDCDTICPVWNCPLSLSAAFTGMHRYFDKFLLERILWLPVFLYASVYERPLDPQRFLANLWHTVFRGTQSPCVLAVLWLSLGWICKALIQVFF